MFLQITTMAPMAEQPENGIDAEGSRVSETEYNLNSPGLVCENVLIRKDGSLVLTGFHSAVSAVLLMSLVPRKVVISRRAFEDNYVEGNMRQPGMER